MHPDRFSSVRGGCPMPLELYPFQFRDPLTGKWVRARYVATRQKIAARHTEWEITGPPELREIGGAGQFNPHRGRGEREP
jgi:hypothetical protein